MKLLLSKFQWYKEDGIHVTGFIREGNRYLSNKDLLDFFSGIESPEKFEQKLKFANGHFSVVIITDNNLWAATDRLRNFPLFYTRLHGEFIISDDCYILTEQLPVKSLNPLAVECFLVAGYVVNNLTLINDIFQIEAGEFIVIGNSLSRKFYHDCSNIKISKSEFLPAVQELKKIILVLFRDHFHALKNDFIALSLSGGYDSRLIAAMCAKYHPDNVVCYTYGIKDNPEVEPARKVAKRLGLRWINIEYNFDLIKGFLEDTTFNNYYHYASELTSMFFMQDYFAVKYLKEKCLVPNKCVFITGFSGDVIAGSHLSHRIEKHLDNKSLASAIYKEFCGMVKLNNHQKASLENLINEKLSQFNSESWSLFEMWDQKERQAKFIANSAKVFQYFGYRYVLPLWDNLIADFFSTLPFDYKLHKKLYDKVLKEYIFKDYDLNFETELNPGSAEKKFQRFKDRIKPFFPHPILYLLIQKKSPIFYDAITKAMIEDIGLKHVLRPRQSNYYNSYIIQWYLYKSHEQILNLNSI